MTKSKNKAPSAPEVPSAPCFYINDPSTSGEYALAFRDTIPPTNEHFPLLVGNQPEYYFNLVNAYSGQKDHIISSEQPDLETDNKITYANRLRAAATKDGRNFVSVNLYYTNPTPDDKLKNWGVNHLELCINNLGSKDVAQKIKKWLFTVLTIRETLYLYSDSELSYCKDYWYPGYAYSPLTGNQTHAKSARIQFVGLITSKPQISPCGNRITWTVADKTGSSTFYFDHHGPESQYTWDWVLALQPGDLRALPRKPNVDIPHHELMIIRLVKAPLRGVGKLLTRCGKAIEYFTTPTIKKDEKSKKSVETPRNPKPKAKGRSIVDLEKKITKIMAKRDVKLVMRSDVVEVFDDNDEKTWSDEDSLASTTAEDEMDRGQVVDSEKDNM